MITSLDRLIQEQALASVIRTLSKSVDRVVEDLTLELLREPAFRADMERLIRAALRGMLAQVGDEK
jgi:hypothetical protein